MERVVQFDEGLPLLEDAESVKAWSLPSWLENCAMSIRYMDAAHLFASYGGGPSMLRAIMRREGDHSCYVVMRVPGAIDYVHHFGAFPIIKFCEADSDDEYFMMTSSDPLGGPMGISVIGEEIVIFGKSRRWAIYAQRPFAEVAMVMTTSNADDLIVSGRFGWLSASEVLERLPPATKILR